MYQISKNKVKSVDKENECVIDFYRLTDRIDTKQIRFPDFDRFIDRQIDTDFYRSTTPGKQTHLINIIDHWSCPVSVKKNNNNNNKQKGKNKNNDNDNDNNYNNNNMNKQ